MNDMTILRDLLGVRFPDQRIEELIEVYGPVLAEIRKLRELDLFEIHPAVLFDPTVPYKTR
jgi:hypothetical protein